MNEKELLNNFYNWLLEKGYSQTNAYWMKGVARVIINRLGINATIEDIDETYRNYRHKTKSTYRYVWRRFQEFLRDTYEH